jgi:arabinan endo-1,5-alpha-L-arabinosidase
MAGRHGPGMRCDMKINHPFKKVAKALGTLGEKAERGLRNELKQQVNQVREAVAAVHQDVGEFGQAVKQGALRTGDKVERALGLPDIFRPEPVKPRPVQKPLVDTNTPDPHVLKDGSNYYMVATGGQNGDSFTIRHSTDMKNWTPAGAIFPSGQQPAWAKRDFWAPEIHKVGDGYVAYYTARDAQGTLSIGAAHSKSPTGPFTDLGKPLIEGGKAGVIDPAFFKDPATGKQYVYWKDDANSLKPQQPTVIYAQELSADGLTRLGEPTPLIRNDRKWEGPIVEAPEVMKKGDYYYLLYSGNGYWGDKYAMGVARSKSPTGPFEKYPEPILRSSNEWKGPGHGSVTQGPDGREYFVYHAWKAGQVGDDNGVGRLVLADEMGWKNGWPTISDGRPGAGLP